MSFFNLRSCTLMQHHVAHEHPYHQLILATSGVTELEIEGRGERITRERGCLIPTTYHHEYHGDGRNHTLVLDVPLLDLASTSYADEVSRLFERPRFFNVPPELHQLIRGLLPQVEYQPALHSEIAALIIRALYLNLHDKALTRGPFETCGYRERIDRQRLNRYIDAHLAEAIRVDELAALCAMSPGYFHACFRQALGVTPQAYVTRRRLSHARFLLEHTSLTLGRIAEEVGFCDQGSFSRAYRRLYAVTPSFHRQR